MEAVVMNYDKDMKNLDPVIAGNPFADLLNLHIIERGAGSARSEMIVKDLYLNPVGSVHGGCIFTLADVTCGAAARTRTPCVTTVDGNIHFLRPALNTSRLLGEARELKCGKKLLVYEVSIKDQDGKLIAEGMFTFMALDKDVLVRV